MGCVGLRMARMLLNVNCHTTGCLHKCPGKQILWTFQAVYVKEMGFNIAIYHPKLIYANVYSSACNLRRVGSKSGSLE